ncbi:hypothetical protein CPC08DRAFT_320435 [Agrocybe pediades]|nr:hypothetical protein CPC08DRAFT_320435 [Agrocybe pediades]
MPTKNWLHCLARSQSPVRSISFIWTKGFPGKAFCCTIYNKKDPQSTLTAAQLSPTRQHGDHGKHWQDNRLLDRLQPISESM